MVIAIAWFTLVYTPVAHWVWGGGWLMKLGALDFAGGTVVHITAGASALALAVVLGQRKGFKTDTMEPEYTDDRSRRRPPVVRLVYFECQQCPHFGRPGVYALVPRTRPLLLPASRGWF